MNLTHTTDEAPDRPWSIAATTRQMRSDSDRWFPKLHEGASWDLVIAYTLGLSGEAGEVANVVKKLNRGHGTDPAQAAETNIGEELADCLTYLLLLADELDVNLVDEWQAKRQRNEKRWGDRRWEQ